MVLFSCLYLSEQRAIQLEGRGQVIEGLLEVARSQVGFPELSIGRHQQEEVLAVNVDQEFAEGQLLHSNLDCALGVLGRCILIKLIIALH